jgi:hypothetical protein
MVREGAWSRGTAIALVASVILAGCGGGEAEAPEANHPVTEVVQGLQRSFEERDVGGVCRLLTRAAQTDAGKVAHASPTTCLKDVKKVFAMIDKGGGWLGGGGEPTVTAVDADGDSAAATLEVDGWQATVPFERVAGEWKAASFIGVGVERMETVAARRRAEAFPTGRPVQIGAYGGFSCAPLLDEDYPKISGGCILRVSDRGPVPVEMLTPYGGFKFGDCFVDYRISVDAEGSTWTDEWEVEGSRASGCSDIDPCIAERKGGRIDKLPWKGRIVVADDGSLLHRTRACIRTCIGHFTGELVTRLTKRGSRWEAEPTNVGASGFKFDTTLDVYGKPFWIKPASKSKATASSDLHAGLGPPR